MIYKGSIAKKYRKKSFIKAIVTIRIHTLDRIIEASREKMKNHEVSKNTSKRINKSTKIFKTKHPNTSTKETNPKPKTISYLRTPTAVLIIPKHRLLNRTTTELRHKARSILNLTITANLNNINLNKKDRIMMFIIIEEEIDYKTNNSN